MIRLTLKNVDKCSDGLDNLQTPKEGISAIDNSHPEKSIPLTSAQSISLH